MRTAQITRSLLALCAFAMGCGIVAFVMLLGQKVQAAETAAVATALPAGAVGWGLLAAAIATGLSSLGAAYAVAHVGSAAVGALVERPELMGRVLVLIGLAEGIAIYGLIISILILNRLT